MTALDHLGEKFCTTCSTAKPRSEFSERWQTAGTAKPYRASNAYCKQCAAKTQAERYEKNKALMNSRTRACKLKRTYGLTLADFDRMLAAQGGGCAICQTQVPGGLGSFQVDHCHKTGVVRGLLCVNCNRGIGALKDDPDLLRVALDYLEARR